jgi:hypothetical protein
MTRHTWFTAIGGILLCGASASAQQPVQVQLPTFNFTTVSTTVSVPDGGTGLLGGISRASEGSVERGVPLLSKVPYLDRLFKNRGIGRDVSASNMTVIPRIIILEEEEFRQTGVSADTLDAMTSRSGGGRGAAGGDPQLAGKAAFLTNHLARHAVDAAPSRVEKKLPSLAEIQERNELAKRQQKSEAAEFFAKGNRAEADGKPGVAKVYYQMAARRADGDLRGQIAARLAILEATKNPTKLAER